ncbi:unnamed protein product [Protopolystoma xenopodis]|uniref:Uncharacterized protein n=1 Tax=Protopolystoma xenopodis TaxID=117903 RepID=A0A3S5AAR3_9PLAT|nr:unnamed protein product [Protopolystoma xenopodis]
MAILTGDAGEASEDVPIPMSDGKSHEFYVRGRHRCHRMRATQGVVLQLALSTYTPGLLRKPLKSGFSFGMATLLDAADSLIVVKPLLHEPHL